MTKRERLLKSFNGQEVDSVPVSPFIWTNFVNEFCGTKFLNTDEKLDEKLMDVYRKLDFDIMHRTCSVWDSFSESFLDSRNWRVSVDHKKTDETKRTDVTIIKTPEAELKEVREYKKVTANEEISAVTEHFIKTEDDFRQFVKYQPSVPKYDCSRITRAREMIGDEGIAAPWTQGIFNCASEHRKLDDLIMDAYVLPQFYRGMMEYFTDRWIRTAIQFVDAGADVLCYNGNIANGTMVGPNYFEENVMEYEARLIKAIQVRGAHVLYHNCGDSNSMYKIYNSVGFSGLETLTEPPYGDTDIDYALSVLDKNITLVGNIDQIEFLKNAAVEEVKEKVKRLLTKVKPRGNFIIGTSDYLSEGTPYENIKAISEICREYGVY